MSEWVCVSACLIRWMFATHQFQFYNINYNIHKLMPKQMRTKQIAPNIKHLKCMLTKCIHYAYKMNSSHGKRCSLFLFIIKMSHEMQCASSNCHFGWMREEKERTNRKNKHSNKRTVACLFTIDNEWRRKLTTNYYQDIIILMCL